MMYVIGFVIGMILWASLAYFVGITCLYSYILTAILTLLRNNGLLRSRRTIHLGGTLTAEQQPIIIETLPTLHQIAERLNKVKEERDLLKKELRLLVDDRDLYVHTVREYTNTNCINIPLDPKPESLRYQGGYSDNPGPM